MDAGTGAKLHLVREALGLTPAIVMAHPDDETLWCGGLPLRFPFPSWTAIACSIPRFDPIRAHHFFRACHILGVRGVLLPYTESEASSDLDHLAELDLSPYSCLVTHGSAGEYGHHHHRQVHNFIRGAYGQSPTLCVGFPQGPYCLDLTPDEAKWKMDALRAYHGPSLGSDRPKWEHLMETYCRNGFRLEREYYDLL